MRTIDSLGARVFHANADAWRDQFFQLSADMGYKHSTLALFPSHSTPILFGNAFVHTSLPDEFVECYDAVKMGEVDPIVSHCLSKSTALIWSSKNFMSFRQLALYAAVSEYGVQSGVSLPFHGPNGEFGFLTYASDDGGTEQFVERAQGHIAELSCFRDHIMEQYSCFMRKGAAVTRANIEITSRELECLKWCATGKSSWDIARLMDCTEATVNYHFANIRRKFGASSRRMAVVKAIRMGFISV